MYRVLNMILWKLSEIGYSGSVGNIDGKLILTLVRNGVGIGNYISFIENDCFNLHFNKCGLNTRKIFSNIPFNNDYYRKVYDFIMKECT